MGAFRLSPTMVSRKLAALDFIKRYFAEWGSSPSLDEIAAALDVSKQRANELVRQLSLEEQIRHTPGKRRGLSLVNHADEFSQADALLRLTSLGWIVNNDKRTLMPSLEQAFPLTNMELLNLPELDHIPALDMGVENHGENGGSSIG